jgi:hypothetical protein
MKAPVSVNSLDITIYDKHEKAFLWNKVHQPVKGESCIS